MRILPLLLLGLSLPTPVSAQSGSKSSPDASSSYYLIETPSKSDDVTSKSSLYLIPGQDNKEPSERYRLLPDETRPIYEEKASGYSNFLLPNAFRQNTSSSGVPAAPPKPGSGH